MLSVHNLSFGHAGQPLLLREISFALAKGEILCVLGPNGAGKSTLLRCLLGRERLAEGSVQLNGKQAATLDRRELAKLHAHVPQFSHAAFAYTVYEYVLMGRTPHLAWGRSPRKTDTDAAHSALERIGVGALREKRLNALSGGERQLVSIARALAQETPILSLDEPTASLDLGNQVRVLQVLQELARQGHAVLLTTHAPDHSLWLDANVLAMKQGRVLAHGAATEVCTAAMLQSLYGTPMCTLQDAATGAVACVPCMDGLRSTKL